VHRGHIEMLNYARSLGDYLLVCIDSDRQVQELKGHERPINNQADRKFYLENLRAVDEVKIFDTQLELSNICKELTPDVMVKGSDYQGRKITGAEYCDSIVFYALVQNYSTSKIIENINNRK
jgi:D-beta-D-heptose 7-phosphate kinase/D-beta-D-heptose 1-phosphate adenosyltransferase